MESQYCQNAPNDSASVADAVSIPDVARMAFVRLDSMVARISGRVSGLISNPPIV